MELLFGVGVFKVVPAVGLDEVFHDFSMFIVEIKVVLESVDIDVQFGEFLCQSVTFLAFDLAVDGLVGGKDDIFSVSHAIYFYQ